jgi:cob(I)alamin adenosyltransferase
MPEKGLVILYTGGGKGKTTAALGLALRATGYKHRTCMIQFIKGSWHYGEMTSSKLLEPYLELVPAGKGFVGIIDDTSPRKVHERTAREALALARERILSDKYDTVILDEINYAVNLGLVPAEDVVSLIRERPRRLNLVLTGNHATPEVLNLADLVTEMKEIKHPFKSGIRARRGIDF